MMRKDMDFSLLSSYVDGELEPVEASRIARLIATDEAFARDAAQLAAMKAAVAALAPEMVVVMVPQRRRFTLLGYALAACLGAAVVATVPVGLQSNIAGDDGPLHQTAALHSSWLTSEPLVADHHLEAASDPFATKLVTAGLSLAYLRPELLIDGRTASHAGFIGRQGCRLSLFRIADDTQPRSLDLTISNGLAQASWSDGETQTIIVARGMPEARFVGIVALLGSSDETTVKLSPEALASLQNFGPGCIT